MEGAAEGRQGGGGPGAAPGDASGRGGMRPGAEDHFLFKALGDRRMSDARSAAYGPKAGRRASPARAEGPRHDADNLEHVASVCEMAALREWSQARGGGGAPAGIPDPGGAALEDLCSWCFEFRGACPVPDHPAGRLDHVLRLLAYAHMGGRREAMRRYAREHWGVLGMRRGGGGGGGGGGPRGRDAEDGEWELAVMSGVCDALLLLVRMDSVKDLRRCEEIIGDLRRRQGTDERPYLESLGRGERAAAACRLAAMYHLAKSVETLAEFMRSGSPGDAVDRLEFHLGKAVEASGIGRCAGLDVALWIAGPAFKGMARSSARMRAGIGA